MEVLTFSTFDYYLDQPDPDVLILRRKDGAFVAAFSARGATEGGTSKPSRRIAGS
jgi:hypothetical protein